jgi:CBS domain-containing protein
LAWRPQRSDNPSSLGPDADRDGRASAKIRDVMTPDIEVVIPEETLSTAAQLMAECDLDALPVSDNNRLIGTITGRDIAMRVVQEGCDPKEVRVGQAMTGDVLYCFAGESIADVAQKMAEWWVPRLPVVNQDRRPVGIVSLGELIALKPLPQARQARTPEHKLQRARSARQMRPPRRAAAAP